MDSAVFIFNKDYGYITMERGELTLTSILRTYDAIVGIVSFENGLLTALMRRGVHQVEEYIDFNCVLHDLCITSSKHKYFDALNSKKLQWRNE